MPADPEHNRSSYILNLADLPPDIREFVSRLPENTPVVLLDDDKRPSRLLLAYDQDVATEHFRTLLGDGTVTHAT